MKPPHISLHVRRNFPLLTTAEFDAVFEKMRSVESAKDRNSIFQEEYTRRIGEIPTIQPNIEQIPRDLIDEFMASIKSIAAASAIQSEFEFHYQRLAGTGRGLDKARTTLQRQHHVDVDTERSVRSEIFSAKRLFREVAGSMPACSPEGDQTQQIEDIILAIDEQLDGMQLEGAAFAAETRIQLQFGRDVVDRINLLVSNETPKPEDLAVELGVKPSTVNDYIRQAKKDGKAVTAETLRQIKHDRSQRRASNLKSQEGL